MKQHNGIILYFTLVIMVLFFSNSIAAQDNKLNVRLIGGTDVSLGLGFGVGGRFYLPFNNNVLEIGPDLIVHHSTYTDDSGFHEYTETTDLTILAARFNFLVNYSPNQPGVYYVFGTGVAAISMEWEETSPTDTSLGPKCCGGGSRQTDDGTVLGTLINVGVGKTLEQGLDFRVEMPLLVFFNAVGNAAAIAPTLTASLGYSF